jgi:hypothetical protein
MSPINVKVIESVFTPEQKTHHGANNNERASHDQ